MRNVLGELRVGKLPGHESTLPTAARWEDLRTGRASKGPDMGLATTIARFQKTVINPLDKAAFALGIPPPGDALLETTGRRTGRPRVTPVCDCLEGDTFWIVAQRGHRSDYVRNIEADPRVRVKGSLSRTGWRVGTAHILDDDDPAERVRILNRGNRWRRLCLKTSTSMGTSPLTVRIDLDPRDGRSR
jgi:deazaflavin-dependent oxidoreductase (nitroreductase family)